MGIDNPAMAQYVGFGLHVLTGTIAGNIFGQISLFVNRLTPTGYANGILRGILLGIALWLVLFLPLTVYVIQPKLNSIASKPIHAGTKSHLNPKMAQKVNIFANSPKEKLEILNLIDQI